MLENFYIDQLIFLQVHILSLIQAQKLPGVILFSQWVNMVNFVKILSLIKVLYQDYPLILSDCLMNSIFKFPYFAFIGIPNIIVSFD